VLTQMRQFFAVQTIGGDIDKLPDQTRVLMVVHPQNLSQKTLYTIDQWVLAGNAAIIFVDPFAENQVGPRGMPPPNPTSNLEPLFKAWGVKFDTARAVGDPQYALQTERNVAGRQVVAKNLPWLALRGDALAKDEAILAQLSTIVMTTAGSFESAKDGVTLTPLLTASRVAVTVDAQLAGDRTGDPRRFMVGVARSEKPPVLAARLAGTLDSAFPDGLPKEPPANAKPDDAKASETKPGDAKADDAKAGAASADAAKPDAAKPDTAKPDTLKRSAKPPNVILVGDADMLMDRDWIQQQTLFGHEVAQAFANNGDFVINAVEQMAGGSALTDLRGRGVSWHPFELIQRMESVADERYRAKEQELTQQLKDTEQKLSQVPKAAEGAADVLTPEQVKTIEGFRTQLLRVRAELRDVQFALRRDVDNVKGVITALNVGVVPVIVAIVVLVIALRRTRRPVPVKSAQGAQP
jgi:ABC-type uncharacterized transport system involved in gliding motility auxiliary subunit